MRDDDRDEAASGDAGRIRHAEHLRLARLLEAHAANRDGSDKTWVLVSMRRMERLFRSARSRGADGSVR